MRPSLRLGGAKFRSLGELVGSGREDIRMAGARQQAGAMRALLSLRLFRKQMQRGGQGDMLSYLVAALVALWSYRSSKRKQRTEEAGRRTTMSEVLRG